MPWRVFRPVVADSHEFDKEEDPDTDTHKSEKSNTESHQKGKVNPDPST